MKVVWSSKSKRDLFRVIDHLYEKWTENEVNQFQHSLENLIENLKMNTSLCPKSRVLNARKCKIDTFNSLIYIFENNCIYILTLIDNRSHHNY